MKITMSRNNAEVSIANAVELAMDGSDYGSGQLEAAARTADNVAKAFGTLVEMLHERGVLTDTNVKIFLGYQVNVED